MKKYHLISGLPRSGTTLLSTILKQNPRFEASISGPLAGVVRSVVTESTTSGGYRFECPVEKRKKLIRAVFDTYYDDPTKEVAFNTNRGWGLQLPMMKDMYPNLKMIACVRDLGWVLDSFERLTRNNPYTITSMFSPEENVSVFTRCEALMRPGRPVGFGYNSLKEAVYGEHKGSIALIDYEQLSKNPEVTMKGIYNFINEPYFAHDFNNVEASYDEYDADVSLPGLHTTRKKVEFIPRATILPPDVWNNCAGMEFWKNPQK